MLHLLEGLLVGEVDDHHRAVRRLGDTQQPADGLGFQARGTGQGMGGGRELPGSLPLGDHAIDDAGVLTVESGNAAQAPQLFQCPVNVPVADHHGWIGEIHFKRGDAGGEHVRKFCADGFIPVVDGHVEAVIAESPPVGLSMPEVQSVAEGFALVGTGEVDDGGGAAPQGRPAAGVKVIGGGGTGHIQIEMGVSVDKAGEEQAAGDIDHLGLAAIQLSPHLNDFFAVNTHVGPVHTGAGDHGAAFEQCLHIGNLHSAGSFRQSLHRSYSVDSIACTVWIFQCGSGKRHLI